MSGSRLFISIRIAASWGQPLQESWPPWGAWTVRGPWDWVALAMGSPRRHAGEDLWLG